MIEFKRYPHINDLIQHYISEYGKDNISDIINHGVRNEEDANEFAHFIWEMVEMIHDDEEQGKEVLSSQDNTDMLPDLSYEVTKYMKDVGFFAVWEKVSDANM